MKLSCVVKGSAAVNAQSHQTLVELTTMQITYMHKRIHKLHNVRKQKQMNREETVKRHLAASKQPIVTTRIHTISVQVNGVLLPQMCRCLWI